MTQTIDRCRTLFTLACAFALSSAICHSTAVLEWDANPEPNVAGYHVYLGNAPRTYTQIVDVGAQTQFLLTNLNAGVTHYLAVTAYDSEQLESPFSDEVTYTPPVDGVSAVALASRFTVSTNASIQFFAAAGQRCWIAASSDLETWRQIHLVEASVGEMLEFSDASFASESKQFYRVIGSVLPE